MTVRPDFVLVVLGRVTAALVAVASLRIMTTLLEPNDYGLWALLVAFQTFCGLFLINPVGRHINRHTHGWWDDGTLLLHLKKFNRYIWSISILIFIVVTTWWWNNNQGEDDNIVMGVTAGLSIGVIVYIGTWNVTLISLLNMLGFRVDSVVWMIITALLGLVFSSIFVTQYMHPTSWIFGQALGAFIGAWGAWRILRRQSIKSLVFSAKISFKDFLDHQTVLKFCIPLAAATGFMWLQTTGYRFRIGDVWGMEDLGILVIGLGVSAQLAAIIESLAMQFLNPYFYRRISGSKSDSETGEAFSDLVNVLTPVYAIWAGFNAFCAVILLEMLTDTRYHVAAPFVIFGAMIEFARCMTNLWSNAAHVKRQTTNVILPYAFGAAVVWLGLAATAHSELALLDFPLVLVIAGIVTSITMIILMQRLLPISVDVFRLAIGLGIMSVCFLIAITAPMQVIGLWQQLVVLLVSGIIACFLLAGILLHNPALKRLMSTSLSMNK